MECLPTNLISCIEQHGVLPKEISYPILRDIALGLHYLHSQTPPILHRSLSSKHVLLTPNLTAKISNLGSARVLEHQQDDERDIRHPPGTSVVLATDHWTHESLTRHKRIRQWRCHTYLLGVSSLLVATISSLSKRRISPSTSRSFSSAIFSAFHCYTHLAPVAT